MLVHCLGTNARSIINRVKIQKNHTHTPLAHTNAATVHSTPSFISPLLTSSALNRWLSEQLSSSQVRLNVIKPDATVPGYNRLQCSNFQSVTSGANVPCNRNNMMRNLDKWHRESSRGFLAKVFLQTSFPRGPDHIRQTTQPSLMIASQHGNHGDRHENSTEEASIRLTFLCKQTWSIDQTS